MARRLNVDFQLARRRIEALTDQSKVVRARALAAYVGVFDFADEQGFVDASSEEIAAEFEIGRPSWLQYRAVLEDAGLVEVEPLKGGRRRGFQLLMPSPVEGDASSHLNRSLPTTVVERYSHGRWLQPHHARRRKAATNDRR